MKRIRLFLALLIMLLPQVAVGAAETYEYAGMWPALQQPWYFNNPSGVATDSSGNVYVADTSNSRIQKFSSSGDFIAKWGSYGSGDGQFSTPNGIAVDSNGNVYVTDNVAFILGSPRIQKFTSDGMFIAKWGSSGSGDGQFSTPNGIATDSSGNVYVVDMGNNRIQKFSSNGGFISKWGSQGSGDGQFSAPNGIATDSSGNVYVVDSGNHRIQKFTADGMFITKWGSIRNDSDICISTGSGNGQFYSPRGIAIDSSGNVYVTDTGTTYFGFSRIIYNDRIQKFTANGTFISKWGSKGSGDGQFSTPKGITTDNNGNVFVVDTDNNRIQKFTADGTFIIKWGSSGSGNGQFYSPNGITTDSNGNVFVVDTDNNRIQKFTADGTFIIKWGDISINYGATVDCVTSPGGTGGGTPSTGSFSRPNGIAVDSSGNVYAVDTGNDRIQKFTANGAFISKWGSKGSGDGQFYSPKAIAIDSSGYVYVADTYTTTIDANMSLAYLDNYRIQKFTADGTFIVKWGSQGSGDGQFGGHLRADIAGITTDSSGYVYVSDTGNNRIQKFTADGTFIVKWGSEGSGDGQFSSPYDIATDSSGNVYVADSSNDRIQKFSSSGTFIAKFSSFGSDAGQVHSPLGLSISKDGTIYVADARNNRIQKFKSSSTSTGATKAKAIIVAGGGKYTGNNLWDATQLNASFAYRTLNYQGYTGENIYYLSSDTQLDLNNDGKPDIAGDATNANLKKGITEWAKDAESLVIYMVDHGGPETFRMSQTETLKADDLNTWLDAYQQTTNGKVTVIYDACRSGSFLSKLKGSNRKLITSADTGESAYFLNTGSLSFSFMFWSQVFGGAKTYDAFVSAKKGIGTVRSGSNDQNPQIDADGNGVGNEANDKTLAEADNSYIGKGIINAGDIPYIGSLSRTPESLNGEKTATITVTNITSAEGIQRVFGIIKTPDFSSDPNTPITDMPTIELTTTDSKTYTGQYKDFSVTGTYTITVYAIDKKGNLSLPLTTTVEQKAGTTGNTANPTAKIKINGQENSASLGQGDKLSLTIALDPGGQAGTSADWWLYIYTPFGAYYYDLTSGWGSANKATYTGGLQSIPEIEILKIDSLPDGLQGLYNFYFGIDLSPDGKLNGTKYMSSINLEVK